MSTKVVNKYSSQFDVYIGRPSVFGNPFVIGRDGDRTQVVQRYREWFLRRISTDQNFRKQVIALRGKTLGCFCKPQACHGDVIVEWLEKNV